MHRKTISEKEWDVFGKHLTYLVHHADEYRQHRLIEMWENPNDDSPIPEVIFNEIKVSEKLFKKFVEMAEKENSQN